MSSLPDEATILAGGGCDDIPSLTRENSGGNENQYHSMKSAVPMNLEGMHAASAAEADNNNVNSNEGDSAGQVGLDAQAEMLLQAEMMDPLRAFKMIDYCRLK
jgi:hypothetical protein